jgi:hypothetical protein
LQTFALPLGDRAPGYKHRRGPLLSEMIASPLPDIPAAFRFGARGIF